MALIKCKECNHDISKSAKTCPNCGAKNIQTSFLTKFVLGLIVLIVVIKIFDGSSSYEERKTKAEVAVQEKVKEETRLASMTPEQKAEAERLKKESALKAEEDSKRTEGLIWNYSESEDKMGRGKIKYAIVRSLNKVEFDFPYAGSQRATLHIRKHPEYGNDVMISVEKGQFMCGVSSCNVQVKFGEGKATKYSATEPADNSSTMLFIGDFASFIANLKKSKKVYIEAQFYQEGNRVFEFETSNLKW